MKNVEIRTKRTVMKFPLQYVTGMIIKNAIENADTIRFMSAVPTMEYTIENANMFLEFLEYTSDFPTELELGIFDIDTDNFIGMCSLENIDIECKSCELGYWLTKSYVGKGYMTECVEAIIQYAKSFLR